MFPSFSSLRDVIRCTGVVGARARGLCAAVRFLSFPPFPLYAVHVVPCFVLFFLKMCSRSEFESRVASSCHSSKKNHSSGSLNDDRSMQKIIEKVPSRRIQFIIDGFRGEVVGLATHAYGYRCVCLSVSLFARFCVERKSRAL